MFQIHATQAIESGAPSTQLESSFASCRFDWTGRYLATANDPRTARVASSDLQDFASPTPIVAVGHQKAMSMTEKTSPSPTLLSVDGEGVPYNREQQHRNPALETPVRKIVARKVVTTATLTSRTCRWPIGDPADPDFHYCGQLPQSASPYCNTHDRLSYQSLSRRKS